MIGTGIRSTNRGDSESKKGTFLPVIMDEGFYYLPNSVMYVPSKIKGLYWCCYRR